MSHPLDDRDEADEKPPAKQARKRPVKQAVKSEVTTEESERLFPQATNEHRIRISRQDDFSKKMVLHGYLDHLEQTEARVAELWGGGKYSAFLLGNGERGYQVVLNKKDFAVIGVYKRPAEIYGLQPTTGVSAAQVVEARVPQGSSAKDLVDSALLGKVLDLMENKGAHAAPAFDWSALLIPALDVVKSLVERPQANPNAALMEELRELRNQVAAMRAQPGPTTSSITDVLAAVEKLAGARQLLRGDDEEQRDPLVGMIAPLLQLLQNQQGGAVPNPNRNPSPLPAPRGPMPASDPGPLWVQLLRHYGKDFVAAAQRRVNPDFVAEMAMQFVPSEYAGTLDEFARRSDAHIAAMDVLPPLKQFPVWTEKVFAELRRMVTEGDDGEEIEEEGEEEGLTDTEGR